MPIIPQFGVCLNCQGRATVAHDAYRSRHLCIQCYDRQNFETEAIRRETYAREEMNRQRELVWSPVRERAEHYTKYGFGGERNPVASAQAQEHSGSASRDVGVSLPGRSIGGYAKRNVVVDGDGSRPNNIVDLTTTEPPATNLNLWGRASRQTPWRILASHSDRTALEQRGREIVRLCGGTMVQTLVLPQGVIPDLTGAPLQLDPSSGTTARAHASGVAAVSGVLYRPAGQNSVALDSRLQGVQGDLINSEGR